jgi:DNA-binding MarR family transcriptional regulator
MTLPDGAAEARAEGWRNLAALHARIDDELERALQKQHGLSVSEYSVLDVLARQDDYHLRMNQLSSAVVLSQSATTRLVNRLEDRKLLQRYLCPTDRRGIYTEVTAAGRDLLDQAQPTHDAVLIRALDKATALPALVDALGKLSLKV